MACLDEGRFFACEEIRLVICLVRARQLAAMTNFKLDGMRAPRDRRATTTSIANKNNY